MSLVHLDGVEHGCCGPPARADAAEVARIAGFPFEIVDLSDEFDDDRDRRLRVRARGRPDAEPVRALQRRHQVRRVPAAGRRARGRLRRDRPLRAHDADDDGVVASAPRRRPREGSVLHAPHARPARSSRARSSPSATCRRPRRARTRSGSGCRSRRSPTRRSSASRRAAMPARSFARRAAAGPRWRARRPRRPPSSARTTARSRSRSGSGAVSASRSEPAYVIDIDAAANRVVVGPAGAARAAGPGRRPRLVGRRGAAGRRSVRGRVRSATAARTLPPWSRSLADGRVRRRVPHAAARGRARPERGRLPGRRARSGAAASSKSRYPLTRREVAGRLLSSMRSSRLPPAGAVATGLDRPREAAASAARRASTSRCRTSRCTSPRPTTTPRSRGRRRSGSGSSCSPTRSAIRSSAEKRPLDAHRGRRPRHRARDGRGGHARRRGPDVHVPGGGGRPGRPVPHGAGCPSSRSPATATTSSSAQEADEARRSSATAARRSRSPSTRRSAGSACPRRSAAVAVARARRPGRDRGIVHAGRRGRRGRAGACCRSPTGSPWRSATFARCPACTAA